MFDQEIQYNEIQSLISKYYKEHHTKHEFKPGIDKVPYAGRVIDEKDITNLVKASLECWLTDGRYCKEFSKKIQKYLGIKHAILVNSGSSANLLAITALTSRKLGNKKLSIGDEVITLSAGFPTTVAPIIQNNLIPVFVDIDLQTYNVNVEKLKKAISSKTKAIFLPHTLGNPFNIEQILEIVQEHDLWLIEDNCDSFGSKFNGQYTGTFGHISTMSFYPAHHITTGHGGAVCTNDDLLAKILCSFRDWGRDCYCGSGKNDCCGNRFGHKYTDLPDYYDHKYVYSEIGYNLAMTDLQAAIGCSQIDKLDSFIDARINNFDRLQAIFGKYVKYFMLPKKLHRADPAWFAYPLTVRSDAPFSRNDFVQYLDKCKIDTRNLFAGDITKQPGFKNCNYKVVGDLSNTEKVASNTFFLGVYPGLTSSILIYIEECIARYII